MKSFKMLLGGLFLLSLLFGAVFFRDSLHQAVAALRIFGRGTMDRAFTYQAFLALQIENRALESRLALQEGDIKRGDKLNYRAASVYSRYPFNDRNVITVNLGTGDGVVEGAPVLASEYMLLGKIREVRRTQSEVITIFDPSWKSSVRIGAGGVKAMLQGGDPPHLELITAQANVREGDSVFNAAPEFPMNLVIGAVGEVQKSANDVWIKAAVEVPYAAENLQQVYLTPNFP